MCAEAALIRPVASGTGRGPRAATRTGRGFEKFTQPGRVAHPTVKPLDLMRWLVRLVTPPGGIVLEPFAGSGTTAEACVVEGFRCIAIEREATYLPLILARLLKPIQPDLFGGMDEAQPAKQGRWPANVVLSPGQAAELNKQSGTLTSGYMKPETVRTTRQGDTYGEFAARTATETYGDTGGASRFFKVAQYDQSPDALPLEDTQPPLFPEDEA